MYRAGDLSGLIGMMLAAGGPRVLPRRSTWPLHQALHRLWRTCPTAVPKEVSFGADPDVGLAASGMLGALYDLILEGIFDDGMAALYVNPQRLRPYTKALMHLEPCVAEAVSQAAADWAARLCTAENTWASALRSAEARVTESTPNRRQGPSVVTRWKASTR